MNSLESYKILDEFLGLDQQINPSYSIYKSF